MDVSWLSDRQIYTLFSTQINKVADTLEQIIYSSKEGYEGWLLYFGIREQK